MLQLSRYSLLHVLLAILYITSSTGISKWDECKSIMYDCIDSQDCSGVRFVDDDGGTIEICNKCTKGWLYISAVKGGELCQFNWTREFNNTDQVTGKNIQACIISDTINTVTCANTGSDCDTPCKNHTINTESTLGTTTRSMSQPTRTITVTTATNATNCTNKQPTGISSGLGALIAVQFLVIMGVLTGWVCTCVQMKRKKGKYTVS